ncbi:SMP-30/gluconolactonase/LRE family protein [Hyphobacterium sp.]|uniref:SMP-30/gluconolactonase/LRE family protein n=1 Tax=Hyphobacterium sp. TaxID=2004662 RepID=UPI003B52A92D
MMKSALLLAPAALSLCLACSQADMAPLETVELTEVWRTGGFAAPESVLPDPETGLLFVSNVNGEGDAADGNGFISRITRGGEIETLQWATGLDAPKGLALDGDRLYVTDIARIVCIDRRSGEIVESWPAPGAGFLNDAVAGPDGRIYASDSATSRIYVLEDGMVHVWAEDAALSAINGLWMESDRMLAVTMDGVFAAVTLDGQSVTVLGEGLGDADAIAPDGQGGYLSSEWPGRVYHLSPDGTFTVLADTREEEIYINDFYVLGDFVIIPHWSPGEVSGWQIRYSH